MANLYSGSWKEFAKKYLYTVSPSVPSSKDLEIIDEYLRGIKNPEVLILGTTINYRKMLSKKKINTTLADLSREMYEANTGEIADLDLSREKFICANWIDMDLNKKFDLIIGDLVLNNIPLPQVEHFFLNIKNHLKDGGLFITRSYNFPDPLPKPEEIWKLYQNQKVTRQKLTELWWDIEYLGFDQKNQQIDNQKGFQILKDSTTKYPHMKIWADLYEQRLPIINKIWTVFSLDQEKELLGKIFKIKAIKYANDYKYSDICPTYVLAR